MKLARTFVIIAFIIAFAAFSGDRSRAATSATPAARAEIEKHGSGYPASRMLELKDIYRKHLREAGLEKSVVERDLSYGPHARHKLDVLRPAKPADEPMPVLVFVHGGGFVRGNKSDGDIFDNILDFYTRHGVLGINVTYRLAPEFGHPAGAEDLAAALRWVRDNADRYGGDADNIVLMGHSAGAVHVASYTFMESLQPADGKDGVVGAVLMSGVYGLDDSESREHVYFGKGEDLRERAPLAQVEGRSIPLFIIDAEYDPLRMQESALKLLQAVCRRDGKCPRHQQIPGHNHYSMTYHINTHDDSIASDILGFIRDVAGSDD